MFEFRVVFDNANVQKHDALTIKIVLRALPQCEADEGCH
jgi:hypothetical protein